MDTAIVPKSGKKKHVIYKLICTNRAKLNIIGYFNKRRSHLSKFLPSPKSHNFSPSVGIQQLCWSTFAPPFLFNLCVELAHTSNLQCKAKHHPHCLASKQLEMWPPWPLVPTNNPLIRHESRLPRCRWVMRRSKSRGSPETAGRDRLLEERGLGVLQSSRVSSMFLFITSHSVEVSEYTVVASPENVSVFVYVPREQAMNGNLYNEKCKARGNVFSHELC